MAFGRSNSLSINTGATNSLFAQQQPNNPSSQPPPAGGLFGSSTQQSTAAGSLFGGPAAQQQTQSQATGGGLFGSTTTQPQQSTSLFGAATSQPQQTNSLFGNTQSNAQASGTGGSSLFGSTVNQPAQSTLLFGNTQNKPTASLFGTSTTQTQPTSSSLFGGSTLFGNGITTQSTSQSGMFGAQNTQQQQQQQQNQPNAIFGLSAHSSQAPPSLLGASQYRSSQYQPFAGKLTMGQTQSTAGIQPSTQGAVKIIFDEMRPTTRFADCVEEVRNQLEGIDKMIQNQERFCREIESFIPGHSNNMATLAPDVSLIREKVETAENALALDASGVERQRRVLENDQRDCQRCERVVINLSQPLQYRYTGYGASHNSAGADGDAAKEMDLVGNYFSPLASDFTQTLEIYAANLAEIEGHVGIVEQSTLAQAQQLASRRAGAGGSGPANSDETVRELADTLRSFEGSILGAASLVGQCREGVNELILGKLGSGVVGR